MNHPHSPADVLRKIGFLALVGFGTVMLGGPILAALSVALSIGAVVAGFALVGFLVWLPLRILYVGNKVAMENARDLGAGVGRVGAQVGRGTWRVLGFPLRVLQHLLGWALYLVAGVLKLTWVTTRVLLEMSLVALTGVAAGVGMGFLSSSGHDLGGAILVNALVGGLIGLVTGAVLLFHERRSAAARPAARIAG